MADRSTILSADAEEKLLQPIEEYVGKIQAQIDELRVEGSDKVRSLKNHIAIAKEDKNLSKDERDRMIAKDKADLEKAKAVEASNKDKVAKLVKEAEDYLAQHYDNLPSNTHGLKKSWAKFRAVSSALIDLPSLFGSE